MQVACSLTGEHRMVLVACFHFFIMVNCNVAAQDPREDFAGAQRPQAMMLTINGDFAPAVSYVTEEIQMVTAAIFHSFMAGKCMTLARSKMKPDLGAPRHTTSTRTNSGGTVLVRKSKK